jgi:fructose-1,6-bisphosphatase-3
MSQKRMMVKDTDKGKRLTTTIQDLRKLLVAYRSGLIKEKE